MIPLLSRGNAVGVDSSFVGKVVSRALAEPEWPRRVLLCDSLPTREEVDGISLVLVRSEADPLICEELGRPVVHSLASASVGVGDVVRVEPNGAVRTLFRRSSYHNTLFATERCNSFCVMCSQPPRDVDDGWRVDEMLRTIDLIDRDTPEIGISGGEPTLLGDGLLAIVTACRDQLPNTALHILSNGRLFRYGTLADAVGRIGHPDVMFGIPVYSDIDTQHDYVVQAKGAFEDTILGLQNLGRVGVPVEIRIVIHQFTYQRLSALAEFIYRNLTFASHVALMGLEATGFAKANMEALWIDPVDYVAQLEAAALYLSRRGMAVSIYNHQLCILPPSLWAFSRRAISDWKNDFPEVCSTCAAKEQCGGFFSFNLKGRASRAIQPLHGDDPRLASIQLPN